MLALVPILTWPPLVVTAAIGWATYQTWRAVWTARKHDTSDIFWLRVAIASISSFWFVANAMKALELLTTASYLAVVSPYTPIVFIVVWGLPSYIYRKRNLSQRKVVAQLVEQATKEME